MIDSVFGNIRVIKYIGKSYYECECTCNNIIHVRREKLVNKTKTDCGCIKKEKYFKRWVGLRFGRLVINEILSGRRALCMCDCGNESIVCLQNLKRNNTTSCGCKFKEHKWTLENLPVLYKSEYRSWSMMKNRCLNPNADQNKYYKDKTICSEWIGSFKSFFNDMGEKPIPKNKYSIDRINNDMGYYPENCRWATMKVQNNNKRKRNTCL